MIRLLVVGAIRIYRDGLALHFSRRPNFEVVATSADRADAVRLAAALRPNVVLLDMTMPESLATVRDIASGAPGVAVIGLDVPEVARAVVSCAEAGMAGYVTRDASLDELGAAAERTVRGESLISPRVAAGLMRRVAALAADRPPVSGNAALSAREREIADLVGQGLSNKQIAARIHLAVATVKNHVHTILEKLHVQRRTEIATTMRRDEWAEVTAPRLVDRADELAH